MKLRLATVAALAAVAATASPASAGVTCQTDAAAAIAGASVNGPRTDWTPPVWDFYVASLSLGVGVQANTLDEARSKAQAWLQGEVDKACAAEQAATPTGTTTSATTASTTSSTSYPEASALVAAAPIQNLGNAWGPLPLWRLTFPDLNLGVDVQAADEASAREAAIPAVAQAIGETPTSGTLATMSTTDATSATGADATVSVSKMITAGSWSGDVDPETGVPVSAGIPQ